MYSGYDEMSKLPASAFLDWQNFDTDMDHLPKDDYAGKQYEKGLRVGREYGEVHISTSSVWSAIGRGATGGVFSHEGIGYHSCTKELLHGFIDSGARIIVHRWTDTGIADVEIQADRREVLA